VKVVVHDRTAELPARLRSYAERRLTRVGRHFDRVLDAEVEFSHAARNRKGPACMVQILVHMDGRKHPLAQARETSGDCQTALDLALDKVDRQVTKLKEKIKVNKKRPEKAAAEPPPADDQLLLERIRVHLKPESVEDATAALNSNGRSFYVFLDEDSGAINVAFRRPDGGLGVIEPVVS